MKSTAVFANENAALAVRVKLLRGHPRLRKVNYLPIGS
ncbi:hypothetical protein BSS2_II0471 [Brucella suis bv. 1 str. S2]|uniref:Uncharacterized protein n=3 Tax=Brucella TaxID=234 RepID=Q577Q1_BRUAB|nr:hypothetical protein BRA0495 [Brucella suis 1330]AAX76133.1 hypothetical protein BruAb2_0727 [Brucella abortus bv. 1 str. 9-941]ACU49623.1 hypothetical protein BMI_II491 [Brucella microti CCM 4915]AEK55921.1 hypothetical protein BPI_II478 [Brucella pinnipedialis B2/94]AEU07635.1 hypothetical protein BSVBI22_B0490 [Brucella suis VBI22]AHN48234.1 hypothetical protein BSS2_II0471 [Brucella suis bv. 1 str. S2]CDL78036.1 unnamed protein product [Brucella canis str. Oliveri]